MGCLKFPQILLVALETSRYMFNMVVFLERCQCFFGDGSIPFGEDILFKFSGAEKTLTPFEMMRISHSDILKLFHTRCLKKLKFDQHRFVFASLTYWKVTVSSAS